MNRSRNNLSDMQLDNNQNSRDTNNRMNGRTGNGDATQVGLLEQIQSLCFVKTELELYLDTHPMCKTAIDYYHQTIAELKRLIEEYENTAGPLNAGGNVSTESWDWIKGPWPWQQPGDYTRKGWEK